MTADEKDPLANAKYHSNWLASAFKKMSVAKTALWKKITDQIALSVLKIKLSERPL